MNDIRKSVTIECKSSVAIEGFQASFDLVQCNRALCPVCSVLRKYLILTAYRYKLL